jgi:hypothetical protein
MSTTALTPATTPIPVQLSEPEFTAFLFPHLSMPKRGPKCKLGSYRALNLILRVLYTGMQWKCLPIPHDAQGKPVIHDTTIDQVFATWADDGSRWPRWWRVGGISQQSHSSISACSTATAPTPWPKKGGGHWVLRGYTPDGGQRQRDPRQHWVCLSACARGSWQ